MAIMQIKCISDKEEEIIQEFKSLFLTFENTQEFITYIRDNNFRFVSECFAKDILSEEELNEIKKIGSFNVNAKLNVSSRKYPNLFRLDYLSILLQNKQKAIKVIPLGKFMRTFWGYTIDRKELFNEMKTIGNYYILWNKEKDFYEDEDKHQDIETIIIEREYVGRKQRDPKHIENTRIIVKGEDGKERSINDEAKQYFSKRGFSVLDTKKVSINVKDEMKCKTFLENSDVYCLLNEKIKEIQKEQNSDNIKKSWLTGYPDLFVFGKNGEHFFVEVKSENDVLQGSQLRWIRWNRHCGKFKFILLKINGLKKHK